MSWDSYWQTRKAPLERLIHYCKNNWGYKKLFEAVDVGNPGKSLEVGCGQAKISSLLKKRGWDTTGLDKMVFFVGSGLDRYVSGDIFNIPLSGASFDLCLSCGLLEHFNLDDAKKIVSEMRRVATHTINWYPIKSRAWTLSQNIRRLFGTSMPGIDYFHTPQDLGYDKSKIINFWGLKFMVVYD